MKRFSYNIINSSGSIVGHVSGTICNSLNEVNQSLGFTTNVDFIRKWERKILGGFQFPISVLTMIEVEKEFENQGLGSKGMQQFNQMAISFGAVMGIVRIGWQGDPVEERKAKSLHFYNKHGWIQISRENDYDYYLAYRFYELI